MRSTYQLLLFSEYRYRLSGMMITGKSSSLSDEVLLHHDGRTVTSCPDHFYNSTGTNVCNRFVQIPLDVKSEVRFLYISVAEEWKSKSFKLYEVEVYAGEI